MKEYLKTLKNCILFEGIKEEELSGLLQCLDAKVDHFDKKYTVFSEGSWAKYLGIMLSGSAHISRVDYYGNRSIISNVEAGEVFAEAFACGSMDKLPFSVIANEPSDIMFIDASHILSTCHKGCGFHQRLIYNLMRDLANKTIMLQQRVEITSKRTTRDKLMAYLWICAEKKGKNIFEIPFDRQALADYLEVDRSGLSAEISKLRKEGILRNSKNVFELL